MDSTTMSFEGKGAGAQEVHYDQVLRQITSHSLLPGVNYVNTLKVRSALTVYGNDIPELTRATEEFLDSYQDGECNCLGGQVAATMLPGEQFILSKVVELFSYSPTSPTTQSPFDLIDELIDAELLFENDTTEDEMADMAYLNVDDDAQVEADTADDNMGSNMNDYVSDTADDDFINLATTQPSELTYFDADSQQYSGYTAFNQLLHVEEDGMHLGIHRDCDDAFDFDFDVDVLEIVGQDPRDDMAESELRVTNETALGSFHFEFASSPLGMMPQPALAWSDLARRATLHSSKRKKRRPELTLTTRLEPILEEKESVSSAYSSASSGNSLDFADRREYVKPLAKRRMDFLDDEDDQDNGVESKRWSFAPNVPDIISSGHVSVVDEGIDGFFSGDIWHVEPSLALNPLAFKLPITKQT
ncbi:hypothetical protein N0V83_008023 [Neocucurbitaria cava]|uniref:Uncharacterized protein n=1 Tax=Neocucurbitaria cava TaxID=798079 RepID=A0A9W8Y3E4_9PLEO|nr:hypothetical protein N0V83_008023 [Neocucurbitaria cava]